MTYRWICIEISVSAAQLDEYVDLFWDLGTIGLEEVEDHALILVRAFFPGAWSENQLETILLRKATPKGLNKDYRIFRTVSDPNDWVENYKQNFHGFAVGTNLYIHPSWEEGSPARVNLVIDPGHAFGTGTHESTQLCLLALEELIPRAHSLLDIGTGSGILAIAAQKLNPSARIVALDVDYQAVEAARENAARNESRQLFLLAGTPDAIKDSFDLVVANLSEGIFRQLAAVIARLSRNNLIVSGFTAEQEHEVIEHFGHVKAFDVARRWEANGWVCLCLRQSDILTSCTES